MERESFATWSSDDSNLVPLSIFVSRRDAQNFITCTIMKLANPFRLHEPRHLGAVLCLSETPRKMINAGPGLTNETGRKVTAATVFTPLAMLQNSTPFVTVARVGFLYAKSIIVGSVIKEYSRTSSRPSTNTLL